MGVTLGVTYLIGMLASVGVGRARIGLSQRGRMNLLTIFGSLPWFFSQMASMLVWPVFLGVWLARGRPDTPWKAVTTSIGTLLIRRKTSQVHR